MASARELRSEPRQSITLRVRIVVGRAEIDTYTDDVSRSGFSLRLHAPPPVGAEVGCVVHLPDGTAVNGRATCRNVRPGGIAGFSLAVDRGDAVMWDLFVEQEETAGSLWRMLSRYVAASDEPGTSLHSVIARGPFGALVQPTHFGAGDQGPGIPIAAQRNVVLQLYSVGDSGEAYRIVFEKHKSDVASMSPLCQKLPGFAGLAQDSIARVLRENLLLRLNDNSPIFSARVCALTRGGFAYLQRGDEGSLGLVSLCVGELILVSVDGNPIFPYFEAAELARIAIDVDTRDLTPSAPMPRAAMAEAINPELGPRAPTEPAFGIQSVPTGGVEALRFAQARAERVQTRHYGDRVLRLFPDVWARACDDKGHEVMGPTMEDGERTCVLALYGHGAPRVVRLSAESNPELVEPMESDRRLPS